MGVLDEINGRWGRGDVEDGWGAGESWVGDAAGDDESEFYYAGG